MNAQLLHGERVRLTAMRPDADAETFARWTHDADYLHRIGPESARPVTAAAIKKQFDEIVKEMERNNEFFFVLRPLGEDRAIGFARIFWLEWPHGMGHFSLGIGSAEDRNKGAGSEAMRLLLRFGFDELNLHRLGGWVAGWNEPALRFFARFGFVQEVRRREAVYHLGKRYDNIVIGLLKGEWNDR